MSNAVKWIVILLLSLCSVTAQAAEASGRQCNSLKPFASGDTVKADPDFKIGGAQRSARYYVPSSYDGKVGFPLIVMLPGTTGNAEDFLEATNMRSKADTHGYVLVAIEGYDLRWNTPHNPAKPDDMAIIRKVKDWTIEHLCIDPKRVFILGYSGGARTASRAVCEVGGFAGLATSSGIRHDASCPGVGAPLPVIAIHGDADPMLPYEGGLMSELWRDDVESAIRKWAASNGCELTYASTTPYPDVERRVHGTHCAKNAEVVLYKVKGGRHFYDISKRMDESQQYVNFFNGLGK